MHPVRISVSGADMTKSRDPLVDEMLDREAIRDLAIRCCDYIWPDEISQAIDTFTADSAFIAAPPPGVDASAQETRRKAEILWLLGEVSQVSNRAPTHNHAIELPGNGRARSRAL